MDTFLCIHMEALLLIAKKTQFMMIYQTKKQKRLIFFILSFKKDLLCSKIHASFSISIKFLKYPTDHFCLLPTPLQSGPIYSTKPLTVFSLQHPLQIEIINISGKYCQIQITNKNHAIVYPNQVSE